jgi:hypothetical protein
LDARLQRRRLTADGFRWTVWFSAMFLPHVKRKRKAAEKNGFERCGHALELHRAGTAREFMGAGR